MENRTDLLEILQSIDPALLEYQDWMNVGFALKHEGYSVDVFDEWSRRDAKRFKEGECTKKWNGAHGAAKPITGGTIVQLARAQGWAPQRNDYELDWEDEIGGRDAHVVVNEAWVEGQEVSAPSDWKPAAQLVTYLETLFEASETVGYVTESYEKEGRYLPSKGNWDRTAGQLIEELSRCGDDIGSVLGDYKEAAGAWIRFNPLDGHGVKNENVCEYKYALVESDTMDIDRQNALLRELELPIACLVHSGKKSLHAIVRVEAGNYDEYRKRVDYLYTVCQKNGLKIDGQNRNPSRLSRMPGVMRNGQKQFLVDINIGKESWNEWHEWIEGINDDLPEPESMESVWDNLPDLSPPLIDGVLRQGHKMLLAGPSKAGKSYSLIELCCAIAEGRKWLTWQCTKGRVLYVNLELDRASCLHRFKDVYNALGWAPENLANIDIWNLRGKSVPMDKLAPKLIRRAAKKSYIAIIIDPIYKVITGDENSADQMAHFCNQFDRVCAELGAAVIYCHHHSKGTQGQKRSMDRASGSGVFARDPDALLDLIELELNDSIYAQMENNAVCKAITDYFNRHAHGWQNDVSQDDQCSSKAMLEACKQLLTPEQQLDAAQTYNAAHAAVGQKTAWRIEGTLREYPKFPPVNLWFDYPIHRLDSVGVLADVDADGEQPPWQKAAEKRKKSAEKKRNGEKERFEEAFHAHIIANFDPPLVSDLADSLDITESAVRKKLKKYGFFIDKNDNNYVKMRSSVADDGAQDAP